MFTVCHNYRDSQLISKTQYKTLLDQSVELARLKVKITKLEILLKEKSADIKKLHVKNRYYENVLKTKTSEVKDTENPSKLKKKADQNDKNVRDF